MVDASILQLSWQIQVALASGYASYLLAYMGIRRSHGPIDTAFISLVFSLVASVSLFLLEKQNPILAGASAFGSACITAVLWRRCIRNWLYDFLRWLNVTWSNNDPSAFDTLANNTKNGFTQIAVELDDGTWLMCDNANKFNDAPFNPAILGQSGDVALYVTHEEPKGGAMKELENVRNEAYGDLITYIPAARIRTITIRHLKR